MTNIVDKDPWPTWADEIRGLVRLVNEIKWQKDEIGRLREALLKISELEPEGPLGNDCMAVSYASETARTTLEGEKIND